MYSYKSKDSFSDKLPVLGRILFRLGLSLLISGILSLILSKFLLFTHKFQDSSMSPSYHKGDRIWLTYSFSDLAHDTIILAKVPNSDQVFFGRVAGLPGEKISIVQKKLYRNGNLIKEPYIQFQDNRGTFPLELSNRDEYTKMSLGKREFFVLCDNRDTCMDSREYGPVSWENIIAKKLF